MIKLAPAPNAAARTLRDGAFIGLTQIVIGAVGWMAFADSRAGQAFSMLFFLLGFAVMLPTLIAQGIRLERERRDSS